MFPQEYLERNFNVALSDSFTAADRVGDVEYKIVQKPKCKANDAANPVQFVPVDRNTDECPTGYTAMLSLCPYLSKTTTDANDEGVESYFSSENQSCVERTGDEVATGLLSKTGGDTTDAWVVDLKVPPVEGTVAQDWPANCPTLPDNDKDYGCDLWVEVTDVHVLGTTPTPTPSTTPTTTPTPTPTPSPTPTPEICADQADVMLVLDRSGSIDAAELATLKTAAHAFVTALAPDGGVHVGQTSFATTATLDYHLSGDHPGIITPGIDALVSGGFTDLRDGILLANGELANTNLPFERPLVPDFMVVITDGEPNRPVDEPTARAAAIVQANAARAAGIQVFVVGVGVTPSTETFLKTSIADNAAHYFSVANYTELQDLLEDIANCQD